MAQHLQELEKFPECWLHHAKIFQSEMLHRFSYFWLGLRMSKVRFSLLRERSHAYMESSQRRTQARENDTLTFFLIFSSEEAMEYPSLKS